MLRRSPFRNPVSNCNARINASFLAATKATPLAHSWLEAWTRRDLEAVLRHYGSDIEFPSLLIWPGR